ncbi:MAG: PorT family protein [Flavobacteriales bacterium]|nr:PorT family protein [Flavobacteriales bacterium]
MKSKPMLLRALALVVIATLTRSDAMSQMTRFEAGLQGGPSIGWLRGNSAVDETDALVGPSAGLTVQYNLSSTTGIRLGAGYQQKGSSTKVAFTDSNGSTVAEGTARYELQYLSIPLMLRFGFGDKVRVTAGAGGYAGVLMSAQLTSKGFDIGDQTVTDDFENLDLGICASIAGSMQLSTHLGLNVEARYDKGLTNISALPVINDDSIRTNAVCLLVGCSYRFGSAL